MPIRSFTADRMCCLQLRGLDRDVPKKKLNLLQFTAGGATQPGTRPSIMPHAAFRQSIFSSAVRPSTSLLFFRPCKAAPPS